MLYGLLFILEFIRGIIMATDGTIEFPVKFGKPDGLDAVDKAVEKLENKEVKLNVKADTKELEKGNVEGFLKTFKEFSARIADGGIVKGFGQIKDAAKSFGGAIKDGQSPTTALAQGVQGLGVESLASAGLVGALVVGTAKLVQWTIEAQQETAVYNRNMIALGEQYDVIKDKTNGLLSVNQAFALQQAAMRSGIQLNAVELASLTNEATRFSRSQEEAQQRIALLQQALSGNAGAARELGVNVSENSNRQQIYNSLLEQTAERTRALGPAQSTAANDAADFGNNLEEIGKGLKSLLVLCTGPLVQAIAYIFKGINAVTEGVAGLFRSASSEAIRTRMEQEQQAREAARQAAERFNAESLISQTISARGAIVARSLAQYGVQEQLGYAATNNAGELRDIEDLILRTRIQINATAGNHTQLEQQLLGYEEQRASVLHRINVEEPQRIFDLNQQNGLLQTQLNHLHIGLNLGTQALTNHQAENNALAEINRIRANAIILHRTLTAEEQARITALAGQVVQYHQAAQASGEQARQQRIAREQAEFQLSLTNQMAAANNQVSNASIRRIAVERELSQVSRSIANFHFTANNPAARDLEIAHYNRLVERQHTLLESAQRLADIRRDGMPVNASIAHLMEVASNGMQRQLDGQEELRNVGREELDVLSTSIQLRREAFDIQVGIVQGTYDAVNSGEQLTATQQSVFANASSVIDGLNLRLNENHERQTQIAFQLSNQNISETERNTLLQERNQLLQSNLSTEQQIADIQTRQNGPSFNQQLSQTVRGLAGEYRSFGSVMGGIASAGLQTLTSSFKTHLGAVIAGKESLGDALKAMAHETLLTLGTEASGKALMQLAEGIAASARVAASYGADVGAAAAATAHYTAAATYGAVAALALGGAALTAPAASSAGSSSPGTSAGGISGPSGRNQLDDIQQSSYVININGAMYLTKEQVEDAVLDVVQSGTQRRGN